MAREFTITIDSVLGGVGPIGAAGGRGTFLNSLGIDPELPLSSSAKKPGGYITGEIFADFTDSNLNGTVVAIIPTPKTSVYYVVLANGRLISYNSAHGSETLIGTVTGSQAYGGFYYNNYV